MALGDVKALVERVHERFERPVVWNAARGDGLRVILGMVKRPVEERPIRVGGQVAPIGGPERAAVDVDFFQLVSVGRIVLQEAGQKRADLRVDGEVAARKQVLFIFIVLINRRCGDAGLGGELREAEIGHAARRNEPPGSQCDLFFDFFRIPVLHAVLPLLQEMKFLGCILPTPNVTGSAEFLR